MQGRAVADASEKGVADMVETTIADFNTWVPTFELDVILANHSLHHVVEVEHLLAGVHEHLADDGVFVISDIIGRNGHLRWPEALDFVRRLWRNLPDRYKFDHQLKQQNVEFLDWDCSGEGFKGIRAQDLLPELLKRFHPGLFLAFANVIDIFVDRSYGPNFDPHRAEDVDWLSRIADLDETLLDLGLITPTHLMTVMHKHPVECMAYGKRTPQRCLRPCS